MRRIAVWVVTAFLLFNWKALCFSEVEKSTEELMREEGLITEEEYNAAKESRSYSTVEQPSQTQEAESQSDNQLKEQTWELGTEISHITYKEPTVSVEEKGMMYGILGSFTYHNAAARLPEGIENFMFKAEGRFSYGQVDYTGSGTVDNINDYMLEFRGLGGLDFSVLKASTLTPYTGIAYRYLNDDMSGKVSSTGALGYERESNYIYTPLGIETITRYENGWSIGATAEYDFFWWGKQKSNLSSARLYNSTVGYYSYPDIENRQTKGYGLRGSIKLQKKGRTFDVAIEPFVRYWNIEDSKTVTASTVSENGLWLITATFVEPKNNSTEFGCKLALNF